MAWTTPRTWVTSETVTAAVMNTHVRDNFNATTPGVLTTAGDMVYATAASTLARLAIGGVGSTLVTDGTDPIWRTWRYDTEYTDSTTTSTSYAAPANGTPTIATLATGERAVWWIEARIGNNTAGQSTDISMNVSGDSTIASSANFRALYLSSAADDSGTVGTFKVETGLTAGNNTFALHYKVSGGTGTFHDGRIMVLPIS